jgi:hypothetical protein
MIVLGVLAVLLGVFNAYKIRTFDPAEFNSVPEVRQQLDEQVALLESMGLSLHGVMLFSAALTLGIGAVLGALGFGVRSGRTAAMVGSIILVAVVLLLMALALLATLAQGAMTGSPVAVAQSCFPAMIVAALSVLLVWLIRAVRAAPHLKYARQWSQWQATQMEQARQYFQQQPQAPPAAPPPAAPQRGAGGYHQYPVPPASPPAAQPPPSSAPASNPPGDRPDGPPTEG